MLVDGYLAGPRHAGDAEALDEPNCPRCGATNDPTYRYCRNCAGRLD